MRLLALLLVLSPFNVRGQTAPRGGGFVEGRIPQQGNIAAVNPVVAGAAQPAINLNFVGSGLDTFSPFGYVSNPGAGLGVTTVFIGSSPSPSSPGMSALAVEMAPGDFGTTTVLPPWICSGVCGASGAGATGYFVAKNVSGAISYTRTYQNAQNGNDFLAFLIFNTPNLVVRNAQVSSNNTQITFNTQPLKGSVLVATFACNIAPCLMTKVVDTQGNLWNQVAYISVGVAGTGYKGYSVWITSQPTAAAGADQVIVTPAAGNTVNEMSVAELTGVSKPALFNTPGVTVAADQLGNVIFRQDAQGTNLWNCTVTLSTATTSLCQTAPTTTALNGLLLRPYVTDFQFNTTAAGTGTTVQLQYGNGANCATGLTPLSAIQYPNTVVGITSVFGVRTPLIGGQNTAICATQAGTTPGTTVVEVRGFFAP